MLMGKQVPNITNIYESKCFMNDETANSMEFIIVKQQYDVQGVYKNIGEPWTNIKFLS